MTRHAVITDPSEKLRVVTEDADLPTRPHLPPSLPSSLCPSLHPSIFPLYFFPSLTCLGSKSRDSLINFSSLSQKYLYKSQFLSYNDDVQFLCLLPLLRIIRVHTSPPLILQHRLLSLVAGIVQDQRLLSITPSHRHQQAT